MSDLAGALVLIFCTPLGWIGLMVFGMVLSAIIEAKKNGNELDNE